MTSAVLIGLQAGVFGTSYAMGSHLPPLLDAALDAVFVWVGCTALIKRMHDLNVGVARAAMFAIGAVILMFATTLAVAYWLGEDGLVPGAPGFLIISVVVAVPFTIAMLWLHFSPGIAGVNRFGPEPDASGFSNPARGRERAPGSASVEARGLAA